MKKRQEVTVRVVTGGPDTPVSVVRNVLEGVEGVTVERAWSEDEVEELPEVNKERLIKLAAWAAGEDAKRRLGLPNEWRQASYFTRIDEKGEVDWQNTSTACGTACCIAGKVALEDGGVPDFDAGWYSTSLFKLPDGSVTSADEYAQEALGLATWQASELFGGSNDLDDVLRVVAELVGTELQD